MTSLLEERLFLYKLQDGRLAIDHPFCYMGYSSQLSSLKKHVQHLQLLPARAKPTSKAYKPFKCVSLICFHKFRTKI